MPSIYGYQFLQSTHEKNLFQFLPSAIFDSMYIVKRKFLKKYAAFFAISFGIYGNYGNIGNYANYGNIGSCFYGGYSDVDIK